LFSYCGKILHLKVTSDPCEDGTFKAYVTFDHPQSVETALVLNGTTLNGLNTLHIELAPSTYVPDMEGVPHKSELTPELQKMTDVMSNLIAGGYKINQNVMNKAKEFDEKVGITDKLKETKEKVEKIGEQLDEKLHITEKIEIVQTKIKEVETKLDLSNKTKEIGETTKNVFQTIQNSVQTNMQSVGNDVDNFIENHENIKKGVDQAKQWGQFLFSKTSQVVGTLNTMINETSTQVQQKVQENSTQTNPPVQEKIKETN